MAHDDADLQEGGDHFIKINSAFDNLFVPGPPRSLALRDDLAS
jgi:hypothetical protein